MSGAPAGLVEAGRRATHAPPWALLLLWGAAVLAGGLRSETMWLFWSGLFWLLVLWSPPDGPAMDRVDVWWAWGGWLLLSGGFAYTGGLVFFVWRRLPFNHALWHFCVLGGAVCHFLLVAIYALPEVQ